MRRVIEIRLEKQKPKLNDLLKMFKGKDKKALKSKMISLYEEQENVEENLKYTKLMSLFDRIFKVLSFQLSALGKIDKRMTKLQRIKNQKTQKMQ